MSKDEMEGWLTTSQAADLLGVSQRRVRQLIDEQQWPHRYLNDRLILIDRETIESYKDKRQTGRKGES